MDEREFESLLNQLMKQDFAAGTEAFRDALLARCLSELDSDDRAEPSSFAAYEVGGPDLELLAAAGDIASRESGRFFGDNGISSLTRKDD